jgi:sugar lactone lactonase YvrE
MPLVTSILADGFVFLEGPRWRDGRLFVSDMHDDRVLAVGLDGRVEAVLEVPGQPSGLGWLPDGRLLVVSMTDRKVLRVEAGGVAVHADLSAIATFHANDMVVDGHGRAYVGNFGWDYESGAALRTTALALVHPDGRAVRAAEDLAFPNGMVLTPDGRTLIVAETFARCLTAFDVAPDGSLANRRVWASVDPVFPDGICLDAAGAIWVASPLSSEVVRVREGGEVTDRIAIGRHTIACMLGGPDRRMLFVLTSQAIRRDDARAKRSARIETVHVDVAGAGLP